MKENGEGENVPKTSSFEVKETFFPIFCNSGELTL